MLRIALFDILLFIAPFAVYGLWLYARRARTAPEDRGGMPVLQLAAIGIALGAIGLVLLGVLGGRPTQGRYVPAQYRDGVLVPGYFEEAESPQEQRPDRDDLKPRGDERPRAPGRRPDREPPRPDGERAAADGPADRKPVGEPARDRDGRVQ